MKEPLDTTWEHDRPLDRQRELETALTEARRAREAAEAASRAKDELLAHVSHELRTPMNAILGMTELVLETRLGDGQRRSLETVRAAASSLLGTLNDLLDFAKIDAGKLDLDPTRFRLRAALAETLRAQAVRAHKKGLELLCQVATEVPDVLVGDVGRLRQVLVNLIDNAIKFTERGEVLVEVGVAHVERGGGEVWLRFAVRDTGIGIPRDRQESIFRAYEQQDMSTTRKYGGTGLGLTIAGRLIGLMGGELSVDSELHRGSTFHFTARFGRAAGLPCAPPPAALRAVRVLVVDDNALARELLEGWLRGWGVEVTAVRDGMAAMDQLWEGFTSGRPYGTVLLDAHVVDTDSLALAARIRERSALSATRIVLLTSTAHPDDAERFREVRPDASLCKPVLEHELCDVVATLVARDDDAVAGSAPLRIVVADDSEFNCELLEHLLARRGHEVRIAHTGREALQQLAGERVDLLLLDVRMPELDGFEVIRELRARELESGVHLPVIGVTARSRREDLDRCVAAGMDDCLVKPIRAADLWAAIDRAIASR